MILLHRMACEVQSGAAQSAWSLRLAPFHGLPRYLLTFLLVSLLRGFPAPQVCAAYNPWRMTLADF